MNELLLVNLCPVFDIHNDITHVSLNCSSLIESESDLSPAYLPTHSLTRSLARLIDCFPLFQAFMFNNFQFDICEKSLSDSVSDDQFTVVTCELCRHSLVHNFYMSD